MFKNADPEEDVRCKEVFLDKKNDQKKIFGDDDLN